jgi:acyl-CoA thioesterase-1
VRPLRAGALVLVCVTLLGLATGQARADGVVVALGDSLTAGLGVAADEAFPARLEARLKAEGYAYRVVNAGVSGDTTAGGLRRVDWVLRVGPEVVIVALGANDGLRGQSPQATRANLEEIVARRARVALMPFLLDGVAGVPRLNQADGIHPTAAGQQVIADHLWPYLRPLLRPAK